MQLLLLMGWSVSLCGLHVEKRARCVETSSKGFTEKKLTENSSQLNKGFRLTNCGKSVVYIRVNF